MQTFAQILIVLLTVSMHVAQASGKEDVKAESHRLVVGTKESPPFAFKDGNGEWTGISIELWRHLADQLDLEYEFREESLDRMFDELEHGELDAAVAALSVTAERMRRVEFCHPHFTTGLGIVVSSRREASLWAHVRRMASRRLLILSGIMLGTILLAGFLFWVVERNANATQFGRNRQGIGLGLWWSAILMLGHKGIMPASTSGRVVAFCAMLASILLISLLTGFIASVLTVQQLESGITHPSDLKNMRVVTVEDSTSADYLRRRRIGFQTRATAEAAFKAIITNEADAVVYDESLLKYLTNRKYSDSLRVLPLSFNAQEYAIALPSSSPLRKPINEELLRFRATDEWDDLVFRYLGE